MSLQPVTCCGYGTAGTKTLFDCLIIPGAQTVNGAAVPVSQCGGGDGVYGGAATPNFATTTVCSKFFYIFMYLCTFIYLMIHSNVSRVAEYIKQSLQLRSFKYIVGSKCLHLLLHWNKKKETYVTFFKALLVTRYLI